MYDFTVKDEPFAEAFLNCETKHITKKVGAGMKGYLENGKIEIDRKTGMAYINYIDCIFGTSFSAGVYCDKNKLEEKIKKHPEKADEYRLMAKLISKYSFGKRCQMYSSDSVRAFEEGACGWGGSFAGHAVPNIVHFAKYGTDKLREKVKKYAEINTENAEFYEGVYMMLDGLDTMGQRIRSQALEMLETETDEKVKSKLKRLAETYSHCPKEPARTFAEACIVYQTVFYFDGKDSPGHFDQYMIEFWEKSDYAESREALEDFWEFCHDTRVWNLCISGSDENWNDVSNALTYEILDVCEKYKYHTPNLTMRCHRNTPEKLYRAAARCIASGTGMPTLYNDEAVCAALERVGIPPEDSHLYCMNGCNQIDIQGKSHMGLEDGEVNLGRCVELTLNNGVGQAEGILLGAPVGEASEFETFEDFYEAFKIQMHAMINTVCSQSNRCQRAASEVMGNPIRSLTIEGCVEKGVDMKKHGPLYGHGQILIEGLADCIDSIAAVKKYVYESKLFSITELADALRKNFDGYEKMFNILKKSELRFGNDIEYVDSIAKDVINDFNSYLLEIPTFRGGFFGGGCSPFDRAAGNGRKTGALPSGKKAGEPMFADSIGAVPGKDINGPTALLNSCLSFDHTLPLSGFILNLKFDKNQFNTPKGQEAFINLWKTYFERKGQQISATVVSREELLDAKINPEAHKNLIVRVGGYSDLFINLSDDLQENIIARTDYV